MDAYKTIGRERWADGSEDQRLWDAVYQSNVIEGIYEYPIYTASEGEEPPKLTKFFDHLSTLEWVIEQAHQRPPAEQDILEVHHRLMGRLMDDAGRYRQVEVRVGSFGTPLPRYIRYLAQAWEQDVLSWEEEKPTEQDIWDNHYLFEHIHPFRDGNGRAGRLLLNWSYLRHFDRLVIMDAGNKRQYYEAIADRRPRFHQRFPGMEYTKDMKREDRLLELFLRLEEERRRDEG